MFLKLEPTIESLHDGGCADLPLEDHCYNDRFRFSSSLASYEYDEMSTGQTAKAPGIPMALN